MTKQTKLITIAARSTLFESDRPAPGCGSRQDVGVLPRFAYNTCASEDSEPIRISRGKQVIGEWQSTEIKERLENGSLLPSDEFYDKDMSEWLPLSQPGAKPASFKAKKAVIWPCYCGTGLPFDICCGDGRNY